AAITPLPRRNCRAGSVKAELGSQRLQLRRLDEPAVADGDLEEWPIQGARPEIQEALQRREIGEEVVLLPDVALQQARMVGHAVQDLGRRQAITLKLLTELWRRRHGDLTVVQDTANLYAIRDNMKLNQCVGTQPAKLLLGALEPLWMQAHRDRRGERPPAPFGDHGVAFAGLAPFGQRPGDVVDRPVRALGGPADPHNQGLDARSIVRLAHDL